MRSLEKNLVVVRPTSDQSCREKQAGWMVFPMVYQWRAFSPGVWPSEPYRGSGHWG